MGKPGIRRVKAASRRYLRYSAFLVVLLFALNQFIGTVTADGIPALEYGSESAEKFRSIFESRQLATVEYVNTTTQRINLFLSVYSLDPGDNLTIMVPLRTLPHDITGEPMKESDFREEYQIKRAKDEIERQDFQEAMAKLSTETKENIGSLFGGMMWTMPGEYARQHLERRRSYGYDGKEQVDSGGGGTLGEPEPVQRYVFDGFSIEVYNVSAGQVLADHLAKKGLVMPRSDLLLSYSNQYIAVIESRSKPPIDEDDFQLLIDNVPGTVSLLEDDLRSDPTRNGREIEDYKWELYREIKDELELPGPNATADSWELRDIMNDLIDATFGHADFAGEVIQVELPLDNGKIFFPLGTSGGWKNPVGRIEVLFRVPEDRMLEMRGTSDAYFGGHHWYYYRSSNSNPDFDLDSDLEKSDDSHQKKLGRAAFIYDNASIISMLILCLALFLIVAVILIFMKGSGGRQISVLDPVLWSVIIASIIFSVFGGLMALILLKRIEPDSLLSDGHAKVVLLLLPISLVVYVIGVII